MLNGNDNVHAGLEKVATKFINKIKNLKDLRTRVPVDDAASEAETAIQRYARQRIGALESGREAAKMIAENRSLQRKIDEAPFLIKRLERELKKADNLQGKVHTTKYWDIKDALMRAKRGAKSAEKYMNEADMIQRFKDMGSRYKVRAKMQIGSVPYRNMSDIRPAMQNDPLLKRLLPARKGPEPKGVLQFKPKASAPTKPQSGSGGVIQFPKNLSNWKRKPKGI
tara:strand:+ start:2450 stop:3124 length:675 start_codon:yes stop_codon:yes gene_type:complete